MRQPVTHCVFWTLCLITAPGFSSDFDQAEKLFRTGQFSPCIEYVDAAIADGETGEKWFVLKIDAQMALGKYDGALDSLQQGLAENANSIQLRWRGRDVYRHKNNIGREKELLIELEDLINFRSWRYRSSVNQLTIGQFMLDAGVDAKKVLDEVLLPVIEKAPKFSEAYLAVGDLALAKSDYALAAENYRRAVELDPQNPRGFVGLATAYRPNQTEQSNLALKQALSIDENNVAANLFIIDDRIDAERYEDAESFIEKVLAVNPHDSTALAYRAVVAHLTNQPEKEDEYRKQSLVYWKSNPHVDHLIGKKLSQKYRFAEGARYQRRALVYDPEYLPAKIQLANDLLRLGDEREGWNLADEVYEKDGYNVVAHNLVTLGNHMREFATLEKDGFIVRMDPQESKIYGPLVLEILAEAKDVLCRKYDSKIKLPIIVEIFPEQQDFAIRTFGLPGGAGFLGVCFGRVITMNSPASRGANANNWHSVLWHEFCHVVTLQKTENRMPRWLSEGISVYEEGLRDSAWGQAMNPRFREMIMGEDLTPVSQLSSAFLNPKSGEHLQFAYFESSLVVEYIVEKYGLDVLKRMLDDLAIGMSINQVLDRYAGSVKLLDEEFAAYARTKAQAMAPQADWSEPPLPSQADANAWRSWLEKNPNNLRGLLNYAILLIKQNEWQAAQQPLEHLISLYPDYQGTNSPHVLLSRVMREMGQDDREVELLERAAALNADDLAVFRRLFQIYAAAENWPKAAKVAQQMLAVNPLVPEPHRYLAQASEASQNYQKAAQALGTLLEMDPLDPADVHFRLASALRNLGDLPAAKRQLLQCLEEAPRYLEAHQALLEIIDAINTPSDESTRSSQPKTTGSQTPDREQPNTKKDQTSNDQTSNDQTSNDQTSNDQTEDPKPETDPTETDPTETDTTETDTTETDPISPGVFDADVGSTRELGCRPPRANEQRVMQVEQ